MGRRFLDNLGGTLVYRCQKCNVYLSNKSLIKSKTFTGVTGKAYLFDKVVNVTEGPVVERMMTTGKHLVRDIICIQCGTKIGWIYEIAYSDEQRYKEGHTILERALITVHKEFDTLPEAEDGNKQPAAAEAMPGAGVEIPEVIEDSSEDEDMQQRIERGLAAIVERDYQVYDVQRFPAAMELLHHHRRHGPQIRQLVMQQAANNTFGNLVHGAHALRMRQFHRRRPELPLPLPQQQQQQQQQAPPQADPPPRPM